MQRSHSALSPHPSWLALALGQTHAERTNAYRSLLDEAVSDEALADIRLHLQQQRALGHDAFHAMVEAKTAPFAGVRPAHQPPRPPSTEKRTWPPFPLF